MIVRVLLRLTLSAEYGGTLRLDFAAILSFFANSLFSKYWSFLSLFSASSGPTGRAALHASTSNLIG